MTTNWVYGVPGHPAGLPACCVDTVQSPVARADLGATLEVQGDLISGVPNAWHHGRMGPVDIMSQDPPIHSTRDGIRGRDR